MFPDTNDLQFARERNEFLSEPAVEQELWPEALGFEPTYEDEHAQLVHQTVAEASAMIEAAQVDASLKASAAARSAEREVTAFNEQLVDYDAHISQLIRSMRNASKGDFDLAA